MGSYSASSTDLPSIGPLIDLFVTAPPELVDWLAANGRNVPAPVKVVAMIDTGASQTVIRSDVAESLGLTPKDQVRVNTPSHSGVACFTYDVNLVFQGGDLDPQRLICLAASLPNASVRALIGRDLLSRGILVYTGTTNSWTLSI